jgi:hypothetical protein
VTVEPAQTWKQQGEPETRLTLVNAPHRIRMNQVVHVEAGLPELQCLARVEGSSANFDHRLGMSERISAVIVSVGAEASPDLQPPHDGKLLHWIGRREPGRQ